MGPQAGITHSESVSWPWLKDNDKPALLPGWAGTPTLRGLQPPYLPLSFCDSGSAWFGNTASLAPIALYCLPPHPLPHFCGPHCLDISQPQPRLWLSLILPSDLVICFSLTTWLPHIRFKTTAGLLCLLGTSPGTPSLAWTDPGTGLGKTCQLPWHLSLWGQGRER